MGVPVRDSLSLGLKTQEMELSSKPTIVKKPSAQQLHASLTHAVQEIRIKAVTRGDRETEAEATRAEVLLMQLWIEIEARASERRLIQ